MKKRGLMIKKKRILKKHMREFADERNFSRFYGVSVTFDTMIFLMYYKDKHRYSQYHISFLSTSVMPFKPFWTGLKPKKDGSR